MLLPAAAATYYVDFAAGSDHNRGTTAKLAWQHCPGDANALDYPGGTGLAPGDTVFFKGGVRYLGTIDLNWSGTLAKPILYDGNSTDSFGRGRAVLDGENIDADSRRCGFRSIQAQTALVFRNFEMTRFGGQSSITWDCENLPAAARGYGLWLTDASQVVVDSCYFHEIGAWTNAPGMSGSIMDGTAIAFANSGCSLTVTNCEFTRIGKAGVQVDVRSGATATNIAIINCTFHDYIRWGIDLVCNAPGCTLRDVRIDGITVRDIYQYAPGSWLGCANDWPHFDGVILRIGNNPPYPGQHLGTAAQPIVIRNSSFYNDSADATGAGTAMIFLTGFGGRVLIYNNRFLAAGARYAVIGRAVTAAENPAAALRSLQAAL